LEQYNLCLTVNKDRHATEKQERKMSKYVAYFRVSTDRQGASGLGLEAQQAAVIHSFTEIESGKHDDRPQLQAAIAMCKATGAALLIAKIDRLSRQAAFLLTLRDSGVQIVAADMPHAGTLEFGIRAVVAQHEREEISRRTKAALQAAKARGIKLGSPNPAAGSAAGIASIQASADQFAQRVKPIIDDIIAKTGSTSLRSIAAALTARGVQTSRGGRTWGASQVANLISRGAA
jgi:DNA invertase Pin-like site-specific DNA recombinase